MRCSTYQKLFVWYQPLFFLFCVFYLSFVSCLSYLFWVFPVSCLLFLISLFFTLFVLARYPPAEWPFPGKRGPIPSLESFLALLEPWVCLCLVSGAERRLLTRKRRNKIVFFFLICLTVTIDRRVQFMNWNFPKENITQQSLSTSFHVTEWF